MAEPKLAEWQRVYQEAVTKTDQGKVIPKICAAESVLFSRLQEMHHESTDRDEAVSVAQRIAHYDGFGTPHMFSTIITSSIRINTFVPFENNLAETQFPILRGSESFARIRLDCCDFPVCRNSYHHTWLEKTSSQLLDRDVWIRQGDIPSEKRQTMWTDGSDEVEHGDH